MEFLRTPDSRFENLEGYNFQAHYIDTTDGMRLHYLDENSGATETVLMLHGEPSWSYLYRKMIPVFVEAGYRAVAPDLIGFGKSDKPTLKEDYTYAKHLEWIEPIFKDIGLSNVTLFIQDWGGLIGLRMLEKYDHMIKRVVVANTFLPVGKRKPTQAFLDWQAFSQKSPKFDIGRIIDGATVTKLSEEVQRGYDAPFPDDSYKAGARIFPSLVPTSVGDPEASNNEKAWKFLSQYQKPFVTMFGDSDPVLGNAYHIFHKMVPSCKDMPNEVIPQAGHFLQEDQGKLIAEKVVSFIEAT